MTDSITPNPVIHVGSAGADRIRTAMKMRQLDRLRGAMLMLQLAQAGGISITKDDVAFGKPLPEPQGPAFARGPRCNICRKPISANKALCKQHLDEAIERVATARATQVDVGLVMYQSTPDERMAIVRRIEIQRMIDTPPAGAD